MWMVGQAVVGQTQNIVGSVSDEMRSHWSQEEEEEATDGGEDEVMLKILAVRQGRKGFSPLFFSQLIF